MTLTDDIQKAAEECRLACAALKVGDVAQHVHHERWLEVLVEPVENRITFILDNKPVDELVERLRRLRPFDESKADADLRKADADYRKAYADYQKAYADYQKAYADLRKAYADYRKAYADLRKADADLRKADADRQKAEASPAMLKLHAEVCGCPWDATHDIFGEVRDA